jgi:PAS domain S-box-containing protein
MIYSPIPCHEIDTAGVIQKVNQAECELLGYTPDELIGHHAWEFVPPEQVPLARAAVEQMISHERAPLVFEREYRRRDGTYLLLEIREKALENATGEVVGIRSTLIDVTERNKFYADQRRSYDRMRFVFQSSARAVVIADSLGNVDFMNRAAESITGRRSVDAVGHALDEVCGLRHDSGEVVDLFSCIRMAPEVLNITTGVSLTDLSGKCHSVVGTISTVRNDECIVVGMALVFEELHPD